MSEGSKGGKKSAVWLVVLGVLIGILFAPASGSETRHGTVRYLVNLGHSARQEINQIAAHL
jgi:gas vesicle protein